MAPIQLDHFILGCGDLEQGIAYMEKLSGYTAAPGGSHPGRGTRNALLKLGERSYLEILAPDPAQRELAWHKEISNLTEPLLVGWAVEAKNLDKYAAGLRGKGIAFVGPTPGSRTTPDGKILQWRTLTLENDNEGILPFHIEWAEDSAHPATDAPGACRFERMAHTGQVVETPPPGPGFEIRPIPGEIAQLHVWISGRFGEFVLTSRAVASEAWSKRLC